MITIKKIIVLFGLLFAFQCQTTLMAQIPPSIQDVVFNAYLNGAFNLIVVDGQTQTATFNTADDYNLGVSETQGAPGIDPGFTTVEMQATANWSLKITAPDFLPNGGNATGSIPINNLGVWCDAWGNHQFGVEVTCSHTSQDVALGLTNADQTLIDLNTGSEDSGDQNDNKFVLHWLMGTMNGSMNNTTMFSQLSAGIFSQGQYQTTVVLTMTEVPQ